MNELAAFTASSRNEIVRLRDEQHLAIARGDLMRLFPRIPHAVAEAVLKHGFEKGTGRVGRTGTLSREEKVELAVVAHARHSFTNYDALLKRYQFERVEREEAKKRAKRETGSAVGSVMREWRGPGEKRVVVGERTTKVRKTRQSAVDKSLSKDSRVAKAKPRKKSSISTSGMLQRGQLHINAWVTRWREWKAPRTSTQVWRKWSGLTKPLRRGLSVQADASSGKASNLPSKICAPSSSIHLSKKLKAFWFRFKFLSLFFLYVDETFV